MKRSKFSEQQIAFILRQAEEGTSVEEVYAPTIAAGVRFPVLWLIGGWGVCQLVLYIIIRYCPMLRLKSK